MSRAPIAQQNKVENSALPTRRLLQRKCACGSKTVAGGECAQCGKKKINLQRKLTIGASNDPLEREADRVADQVMAMPLNSRVNTTPPRIQRFSGKVNDGLAVAPASVDRVLASIGRPLEPALRQNMESRFGYDFSQVRIHAGNVAERSARDVNAHAYTAGQNIVFGAGKFAPETQSGRSLLAHELTHVIQQSTTGYDQPKIMRKGFESTISICHRVLESRQFDVTKGGVRVVLLLNDLDKNVPNCRDFGFGVTLTQSEDWWPDDEIATCKASTGGTRSFSFANLSAGTYYLTIWRNFDHPYCCLKGDIVVFDEAVSNDSTGCKRDKDPSVMDIVHGALEVAGFIPILGAIPDGVNALIYVAEGDWTNAGISAVAMAPLFGDAASATNIVVKAGKEFIEASGKTVIKKGKDQLATELKKVAAKKSEKEAAERTAKKAAEDKATQEVAEKAAKEKAGKEAAEKAEKEAAEKAEKEAGEKKKKSDEKKTCATQYPLALNCSRLPFSFKFKSPQAALAALKLSTGKSNLKLASPAPSTGGPCVGVGMHYGVKDGGTYIASISCCPCCIDSPAGPRLITRCRII